MKTKLDECVWAVKARGGPAAKYAWAICVKKTGIKAPKRKSKSKTKRR